MRKYIDADKLYKKVDELMAKFAELEKETEPDDTDLSIFYQGKRKMCSEILTLIISFQQEQSPLPSNIDDAANTFNIEDAARMWDYEGKTEGEIVEAAFKAGAEWMVGQFQARKEE